MLLKQILKAYKGGSCDKLDYLINIIYTITEFFTPPTYEIQKIYC